MKDLSLFILDLAQNSLHANATEVEINFSYNAESHCLSFFIKDNGDGIPENVRTLILNPFYTTGTKKKVGMGLPLIKQAAEATGGQINITSLKKGTLLEVKFICNHIDMVPIGDIANTLAQLICTNPAVNLIFVLKAKGDFSISTKEILETLELGKNEAYELQTPGMMRMIEQIIDENIKPILQHIEFYKT